ncbi:MAG: efflux RND transporter periplasmic adaptor subunit [Bacillota bacterium]
MRKLYKFLIAILIIAIIVSGYYFFIYESSKTENKIDYLKVESSTADSVLRASGVIVPKNTVNIKSSISAKVDEVNFLEGDEVKEDEVILKYDNKLIENQIESKKVQKEKAKLSLEQANISIEEAKASLDLTKTQLENAKSSSVESNKNEIRQAEINLEEAKEKLEKDNELYAENAISYSQKRDQEYQVKILESKLELAQQNLEDRKREINNSIKEREKNLLQSEKKLLNAEKNSEIAKKSYEEAKVAYERVLTENEDYEITAPLEGVILEKEVDKGEFVQTGQDLFQIASKNKLIKINPDERELSLLKENKKAYISPEAYPDKKIEAKLAKIGPSVDNEKGTIDVYYKTINEREDLVYNMSVSVNIINDKDKEKIYIPENYLINKNEAYLYKDKKAKLIEVEIGSSLNGEVEIIDGLNSGDIILDPEEVDDGEKVNIEG